MTKYFLKAEQSDFPLENKRKDSPIYQTDLVGAWKDCCISRRAGRGLLGWLTEDTIYGKCWWGPFPVIKTHVTASGLQMVSAEAMRLLDGILPPTSQSTLKTRATPPFTNFVPVVFTLVLVCQTDSTENCGKACLPRLRPGKRPSSNW